MAFYNVCRSCGATLDPGERCSCQDEKAREQEKRRGFFDRHLRMEPRGGQFAFVPGSEEVHRESKSCC